MSIFDKNLVETFEIIKNDNPRVLKQHLSFHPYISLENYYYLKYTPLIESAYMYKYDMVKFICENIKNKYTKNSFVSPHYKKYLNHVTIDGKTALIVATLSNPNPDIIQYLLQEGVNPLIKDYDNKDVFYYAKYSVAESVEDFWQNYSNNLK